MHLPSTTVELLDALKARRGLTSDYQLYKALGWHQTTVSSYRCGKTSMTGAHAIRIADELELPRAYVLACMEAERERNGEVASVWRELAAKLRRAAAAVILIALAAGLFPAKSYAAQAVMSAPAHLTQQDGLYIMRIVRRCLKALKKPLQALERLLQSVTRVSGQPLQLA